jgi:hypothetical protein
MAYSTEQKQKPEDCPGTVCKNCAHRFEGRHCCHCGQSAGTRRIMTSEILTEALFSVVEVDNGFLFTAKELCLRPGKAIGRYLGGQRVPFYAPHKYLFFIGAVTSFLTSRYHSFSEGYMSLGSFSGKPYVFLNEFFQYTDLYVTATNVIAIPVFALFSLMLFRRNGYNYAEHLVLNTYITSQQLLLFIVWLPLTRVIPLPVHWLLGMYIFITLSYKFWVYVQFCQVRTIGGFAGTVAAMGLAYLGQFLLNLLFFQFGGMYL